jgi:hypothetical protein
MSRLKMSCFGAAFGLAATQLAHSQQDGDAPVTIVPKLEHSVKLTGVSEAVVYLVSEGENPPPLFSRKAVEAICETSRQAGLTSSMPEFDDGWDQPLKARQITILAKHMKYHMHELHTYDNLSDDASVKTHLCVERHRVHVRRSVTISKFLPDRIVVTKFDLETKKGLVSNLRPGAAYDFRGPRGLAATGGMLNPGKGVGLSEVLGYPCVVVPSPLVAETRTAEACFAAPNNEKVPKIMEGRPLKGSMTWMSDGKLVRQWHQATELVPYGLIDSGVFDLPEGLTLREYTDPSLKVQK